MKSERDIAILSDYGQTRIVFETPKTLNFRGGYENETLHLDCDTEDRMRMLNVLKAAGCMVRRIDVDPSGCWVDGIAQQAGHYVHENCQRWHSSRADALRCKEGK